MPETPLLPPAVDVNTLLDEPEAEYNWLIPGLLERGDRFILTGNEGKGKSTLLRQFAVQSALGIHPFDLTPMTPIPTLFIDLENGRRHIRRELAKVCEQRPLPGILHIASWPGGLDLGEVSMRAALTAALKEVSPDLVIIGPMYKLAPKLEQEEFSAALAHYLDTARVALDFTLLMESHQPHAIYTGEGDRIRAERPFGSSLWMRWPEFGFCLEDSGMLRPWRGARDADRQWPVKLKRDGEWPWTVDELQCVICGTALEGKQTKYCSDGCAATGRKRDERARKRG